MANGNGRTAEEVISAIEESRGFASQAAAILKVSRTTFYKYIDKYATAKQALEDTREKRHDYVENKLMKLIDNGNVAATLFYLKTQCKQRGYVERTELKLDMTQLTNEQLERLARGENAASVLSG